MKPQCVTIQMKAIEQCFYCFFCSTLALHLEMKIITLRIILLESIRVVQNFPNKLFVRQRVVVISLYSCVSAEKVNVLQELLNKKDQEMKVMEDRYKKYLEKAKSVRFFVQLSFIVLLFHGLQYLFQLFKSIWSLLFGLEFFPFNNGTVESSYYSFFAL